MGFSEWAVLEKFDSRIPKSMYDDRHDAELMTLEFGVEAMNAQRTPDKANGLTARLVQVHPRCAQHHWTSWPLSKVR